MYYLAESCLTVANKFLFVVSQIYTHLNCVPLQPSSFVGYRRLSGEVDLKSRQIEPMFHALADWVPFSTMTSNHKVCHKESC